MDRPVLFEKKRVKNIEEHKLNCDYFRGMMTERKRERGKSRMELSTAQFTGNIYSKLLEFDYVRSMLCQLETRIFN